MSPRKRFETLDAERRQAILQAAAQEFAACGYDGASYNRIIRLSGVSKGAMYYYFEDKRDLFLTVARKLASEVREALGRFPPCEDALEFWAAVGQLYARVTDYLARDPVRAGFLKNLLAPASLRVSEVAETIGALTEEAQKAFEGILLHGRELGAVRDDLPLDLLVRELFAVGEAQDRWTLERWESLGPGDVARLAPLLVGQHARLAAPLALLEALENLEGKEGRR